MNTANVETVLYCARCDKTYREYLEKKSLRDGETGICPSCHQLEKFEPETGCGALPPYEGKPYWR